jgi:hypothetical protein
MGEEESGVAIISLHDVRCFAMLASRLRAVLCLAPLVMAVEAYIVVDQLAITANGYCLPSLSTTIAITLLCLGLLLPPAARSTTMLYPR